jgi:hypothetical protein
MAVVGVVVVAREVSVVAVAVAMVWKSAGVLRREVTTGTLGYALRSPPTGPFNFDLHKGDAQREKGENLQPSQLF